MDASEIVQKFIEDQLNGDPALDNYKWNLAMAKEDGLN